MKPNRELISDPTVLVRDGVVSQAYLDGITNKKSLQFFQIPKAYYDLLLADWKHKGGKMLYSKDDIDANGNPPNMMLRYMVPRNRTYDEGITPNPQDQFDFAPPELGKYAQHKYRNSGQLLLTTVLSCSAYCSEVCFRHFAIMGENPSAEVALGHEKQIADYIRNYSKEHPSAPVRDVILSGGDPMIMNTKVLHQFLQPICEAMKDAGVTHPTIRIGTKELAFFPERVTADPTLIPMLQQLKKDYNVHFDFMLHFTHPVELTTTAKQALRELHGSGCVTMYNQTPVAKGVNFDAGILSQLCKDLHPEVRPYYLFYPRDTEDKEWRNHTATVIETHELMKAVRAGLSGKEKPMDVGSTEFGKMTVAAVREDAATCYAHGKPANTKIVDLKLVRSPDAAKSEAIISCFADGNEKWFTEFLKPGKVISDPAQVALPLEQQLDWQIKNPLSQFLKAKPSPRPLGRPALPWDGRGTP